MKKIMLFLFFVASTNLCFAQFGNIKIKKPKMNVPKAKKPKEKTSSPKPSSTSSNDTKTTVAKEEPAEKSKGQRRQEEDGAPRYDADNPDSPLYKTYRNIKQNFKWAKSSSESFESKMEYLAKVKKDLDFLNQQQSEKDQPYLIQFNKDYVEMDAANVAKVERTAKIEKYEETLSNYYVLTGKLADGNDIEKGTLTYEGYYKFKDAFKTEFPDVFQYKRVVKKITRTDDFFDKVAYEKVAALNTKADDVIRDMYMLNGDGNEKYRVQAKYHWLELKGILMDLEIYDEKILKDVSTADVLRAKATKEFNILDKYINEGGIEAALKSERAVEIEARRLDEKEMSNSTYEKMGMNYSFEDGSKVIRAVITSHAWDIEKNALDIPKAKHLYLSLGIKRPDGSCYIGYGTITRVYEGGGNYSKANIECSISHNREMNCSNIFK